MIMFCPNMIYFFMFVVGEILKIRLCQTVIFARTHESAEFTNKKQGKPTLHSLIAKHVLEMSIKLKFQCEHFEKKQRFALVVLNWFPIKVFSHNATCIIPLFFL